jgi:hypothetical protein
MCRGVLVSESPGPFDLVGFLFTLAFDALSAGGNGNEVWEFGFGDGPFEALEVAAYERHDVVIAVRSVEGY